MFECSTSTKMREIEARFPFIKQVLFKNFHLGGCASCSYSLDDSIEEVATKHQKDASKIVEVIQDGIQNVQQSFISVAELKKIQDSNASNLLIDVREPWEENICKIPGSRMLSQENTDNLIELAKSVEHVIIICHHGLRALNATLYMQDNGVPHAKCLKGGIDAYSVEIDPTLPRY